MEAGLDNLRKHVESIRTFRETPIVAINRFSSDTEEEIGVIRRACEALGVMSIVADIFERGGDGGTELARTVIEHAEKVSKPFNPLYELGQPIKDKLFRIASAMYGAGTITYTSDAEKDIRRIERLGYANLPLCIAKTPTSLSGDPNVAGRPRQFELAVRRVLLSAGAGYLVPLVGNILRMPGLPREPQALHMDFVDGEIEGLLSG